MIIGKKTFLLTGKENGEYLDDTKKATRTISLYAQALALKLMEYFKIKIPFLSVDVYETQDGDLGIFEYQMQFAFMGMPKQLVVDNAIESIKKDFNIEA